MGMQNFIKIYQNSQGIGSVSLVFRIWTSAKPRPIPNIIWQSHWLHLFNINVYAKFHHNILDSSRDRVIFTFLSIWNLAQPRPIKNVSSQFLGLDLVTINVCANVYQNIPLSSRDSAIFTFSEFGVRQRLDKCILQFLGLDLFNIKLSAKVNQNIPNGLRVIFHFFQNLNLGKTSTNSKCHLTISWATSCQYTNVYAQFHHTIPPSSRDRAIFTFSEFGARQSLDRWKMTFHNLLG